MREEKNLKEIAHKLLDFMKETLKVESSIEVFCIFLSLTSASCDQIIDTTIKNNFITDLKSEALFSFVKELNDQFKLIVKECVDASMKGLIDSDL